MKGLFLSKPPSRHSEPSKRKGNNQLTHQLRGKWTKLDPQTAQWRVLYTFSDNSRYLDCFFSFTAFPYNFISYLRSPMQFVELLKQGFIKRLCRGSQNFIQSKSFYFTREMGKTEQLWLNGEKIALCCGQGKLNRNWVHHLQSYSWQWNDSVFTVHKALQLVKQCCRLKKPGFSLTFLFSYKAS